MISISLGGMGIPKGSYQPNSSILIHLLKSAGFTILFEPTGKFFLAFDHEEESYREFIRQGGTADSAILIRQETDSVYPGQYSKRVEKEYGLILTLGAVRKIRKHDFFLGHAYIHSSNPPHPTALDLNFVEVLKDRTVRQIYDISNWKSRPIYFSFVGANKVGLNPKGNYGVRRKLVDSLASSGLEVYGPLWNDGLKRRLINRVSMLIWGLKTHQLPPVLTLFRDIFRKYKNAKGEVENKQSVLLDSKYSLIVENSDFIITEKLFDVILAGSIPIYYGPDLSQFGLPDGLAIEIKKFGIPIGQVMASITEEDIKARLEVITDFLNSSDFQDNWLAESVFLKAQKVIQSYIAEH